MKTWKDVSPPWQKIILFTLLSALVIALLCACNTEKKIARDDQKSVDRVNAKAPLQIPVVNAYLQGHPIDTATKIILSPGKEIIVHQTKIVKDTSGRQQLIDSVKKAHENELNCGQAAADAYDLGWDECEKQYLANKIKAKCPPDTTKLSFMTSETRRWQDSFHLKDKEGATKDGVIQTLHTNVADGKKEINRLMWFLIASVAILILSHVARSYMWSAILSVKNLFKKA